jgi:triosephosphate isomerase
MRKMIMAGNWKMHKTVSQALELVEGLKERVKGVDSVETVVAPPFTALSAVSEALRSSNILLSAQNLHHEKEGAYTGEISAAMLKDLGCAYVIVGHSERREYFQETDEIVNKKIYAVLNAGLSPILCLGESLNEREGGKTMNVVDRQLKAGLKGCSDEQMARTVIAYEPIWAIGTGKTATPEQANNVHAHLRHLLAEVFNAEVAARTRILYGGSVNPANTKDLMGCSDIDGALVGGASLTPDSFAEIVLASSRL